MRGNRLITFTPLAAALCALVAAVGVSVADTGDVDAPGTATAPAEATTPPSATFSFSPQAIRAGDEVELDASESRTSDGSPARHEWDLDGDGTLETDTDDDPKVSHTYDAPRIVQVKLRVTDGAGASDEDVRELTVREAETAAPEEPATTPEEPAATPEEPATTPEQEETGVQPDPGDGENSSPTSGDDGAGSQAVTPQQDSSGAGPAGMPALAPIATVEGKSDASAGSRSRSPIARAAANASVTIKDFDFSPASVTVDVGDTVTWKNDGPTPHSAKADDGSFDTGILAKGESGSATFDEAGTFKYFCEPHPSMTATVTVGSGGGSGGGDDAGDTAGAGTSGTSDSSSSGDLATTGLDLVPIVLTALLLMAAGLGLNRLALAVGRRRS